MIHLVVGFFLMGCCGLVRSRGPLQSGSDRVVVKHSKQRKEMQFERSFLWLLKYWYVCHVVNKRLEIDKNIIRFILTAHFKISSFSNDNQYLRSPRLVHKSACCTAPTQRPRRAGNNTVFNLRWLFDTYGHARGKSDPEHNVTYGPQYLIKNKKI